MAGDQTKNGVIPPPCDGGHGAKPFSPLICDHWYGWSQWGAVMLEKMGLRGFGRFPLVVWTSLVLAGVTTISLLVAVIIGVSLLGL